jgi:hypothetical protein
MPAGTRFVVEYQQVVGVGIAQRPQLVRGGEEEIEGSRSVGARPPISMAVVMPEVTSPSWLSMCLVINANNRPESVSPATMPRYSPSSPRLHPEQVGPTLVAPLREFTEKIDTGALTELLIGGVTRADLSPLRTHSLRW